MLLTAIKCYLFVSIFIGLPLIMWMLKYDSVEVKDDLDI